MTFADFYRDRRIAIPSHGWSASRTASSRRIGPKL